MLQLQTDVLSKRDTSSLATTSRLDWNSQVNLAKDLENEPQLRWKHYQGKNLVKSFKKSFPLSQTNLLVVHHPIHLFRHG